MPLVYYHNSEGREVGVWQAEEPEEYFAKALLTEGFSIHLGNAIAHPEKRLQWFASRFLLVTLYPDPITLYDGRKPLLHKGPKLSISHSKRMVGVMIGDQVAGIDLQWADPKLTLVAGKFLCGNDLNIFPAMANLQKLTIIWAVKEAVFKHYGTGLPFRQIALTAYSEDLKEVQARVFRKEKYHMHRIALAEVEETVVAFLIE